MFNLFVKCCSRVKSQRVAGSLKKDQPYQQKWKRIKHGGEDFMGEELFELDFGKWVDSSYTEKPKATATA